DNTNLVDPHGDSVQVVLVEATFEKDILIIDETDESLFTAGLSFYKNKDAVVDSFYARIFNTSEQWDFFKQGMVPKNVLGQYKLIIWHADNPYSTPQNVHKLPSYIKDVEDYLNVGGDLIMGGWRILKSFAQSEPFPKTFNDGDFIHDYLHILTANESVFIPTDFTGVWANKDTEFSDAQVDSIKLAEWPYSGKLGYINIMPRQAGFTQVIYQYANDIQSGIPIWRGEPVGLRYYGSVFDTIVLGFPLFFMAEDDAQVMADEMLHSLGYQ
ncbi:MAG: hypothetical protein WAN36_14475, partial [Calditrichia bacterium]